jgi:protein-disulfide isomerase
MRVGVWAILPIVAVASLAVGSAYQDVEKCVDPSLAASRQSLALNDKTGTTIPTHVNLKLQGFEMLGSKSAPITMVEFTDYQCPFCRNFHTTVFGELQKKYIDPGKVRFFSRDMPLDQLHPDSTRAAQAGRCAADQGKFWALREIMGAHPSELDRDSLVADAAGLKLDADAFRFCLATQKYREAVQVDVLDAIKIGVDATPAFVVGKTTPTGVDGELMVGALSLPDLEKIFAKVAKIK